MSICVDEVCATDGVVVASELGFGAGAREVSLCGRFVYGVDFVGIFVL